MIDQNTIGRIMDTAKIEEVVSDYVTLRRRGTNLIGLCPFHDEKTPSFNVSPSKGIFKCFGCGKGGNAVHFLMEYEQIGYVEALKMLGKKYNIEVKERELSEEEKNEQNDRESMFVLNAFAQKWFAEQMWNTDEGRSVAQAYFIGKRKMQERILRKFSIGYCPNGWDTFAKAAVAAGFKAEFLEKTGLCYKNDKGGYTDRFHGRVIFPAHTMSGKVVAFGGRIMGDNKDKKLAKYVNSPESEIYHKSNELYGIYFAKQAIVKNDFCFLVEGYMDVLSMHQAGIENVVASSGTSLTAEQIRLMHRITNNITVLYDGDAAGIHASLRGIDMLLEEGMNIKVLLLPDGHDPDSFAHSMDSESFQQYVRDNQTDFMRFKTNLLLADSKDDPIKRTKMVQDVLQSIAVIPDPITRQVYLKDCGALLDMDDALLLQSINKIRQTKQERVQTDQQRMARVQALSQPEPNAANATNTAPQPAAVEKSDKITDESCNLLQALVRYGERTLYVQPETNESVTVGDYIVSELERDNIVLPEPLHQSLLQEYKQHSHDKDFVAERFFKFHPDVDICRLSIDLMAERYPLSRIFFKQSISENIHKEVKVPTDADRLVELVPRLVFELKNSLLIANIGQLLKAMKEASDARDVERENDLMRQMEHQTAVLKQLSKTLGKRVLIKL